MARGTEMSTRYKRNISARITNFYYDLSWWYGRNKEGLAGGFLLGLLAGTVMVEFFLGI